MGWWVVWVGTGQEGLVGDVACWWCGIVQAKGMVIWVISGQRIVVGPAGVGRYRSWAGSVGRYRSWGLVVWAGRQVPS